MQWTIFVVLAVLASSQAASLTNPHIIAGEEAEPKQFPWQAGIFIKFDGKSSFCGGSLIHPRWVLTAAHCAAPLMYFGNDISFEVVLGAHDVKNTAEPNQQRFSTTKRIFPEKWIGNPNNQPSGIPSLENDIALLYLPEAAVETEYVKVVRLPSMSQKSETFKGQEVVLSGWGKMSNSATTIAPTLQFVKSNVISNWFCKMSFLWLLASDTNICASGKGGKGACHGDSGGPMVMYAPDGKPTLLGVTSFGLGISCSAGWPSAYTRVTSHLDWIVSNTNGDIQLQ